MINVTNKKCEKCTKSQSSFNYKGESTARFCGKCKKSGMINVKSSKCKKCNKTQPSFNYKGESTARFCGKCKKPDMINVRSPKCKKCNKSQPSFNYEGESTAKFCAKCKELDMVNVKDKKCERCTKSCPTFNYEGESTAKFCGKCKEPDMVDVTNKKCEKCTKSRPSFNYEGESTAKFCVKCKESDMVDVTNKKCEKCTKSQSIFNYEGEYIGRFCGKCKDPKMVDVTNPKCIECGKRATYSYPGVLSKYCSKHKKDGMMVKPRRKCKTENCNETATHGIKEPVNCELHSGPKDYNLVERSCVKCHRLDILNKDGICVNFCSLEEQDRIMKKKVKKHEEYINKLLDSAIEMRPYATDTIIDSACSRFRPDRVYHCGTHIVVIEIDENQHKSYTNCGHTKKEKLLGEEKRMYAIGQSFDGLPCIFLRYNPDNYKDASGRNGEFSANKRQELLVKWVNKCIQGNEEILSKGYRVKYLFYDGFDQADSSMKELDYELLL